MKYLIVGLGNIGKEYSQTRHNIGFMVLDEFAKQEKINFTTDRYGDIAKLKYRGKTIILLKPSTYMNLSGKAYKYWLDKENINIENSFVICDDLDLELGVLRIRYKGGGGSHNGLNNIIEMLNTQNFCRLRFGIGNDFSKGRQVDYVLGNFFDDELLRVRQSIEKSIDIVKSFVFQGVERTMNQFNNKDSKIINP